MIQLYLETKVYIYGPKLSDSSQVVQNYLSFYTGSYEYKNTYKFLVLQEIYMCFVLMNFWPFNPQFYSQLFWNNKDVSNIK